MTQLIKALAAKPDDPSSSPEAHLMEREIYLSQVVL